MGRLDNMIDIIIPTVDAYKHVELCVSAIERFTRNPFKIILVDNGSRAPEAKKFLASARERGHVVVSLPDNVCFSKAVNAGLSVSKAEYVSIINDDAYVNDGWDGAMIADLSDPTVGMVGASSNAAAGFMGAPEFAEVLPVPYLVFVHVMLKRSVIDKVGLLDAETFTGFGSEDLDYSWRVRAAGYRLKVSRAFTFHVGGMTMGAERFGGVQARDHEYRRMSLKLEEKWGHKFVAKNTKMFPKIAVATPSYEPKVWHQFFRSMMLLKKTGPFQLEYYQTSRTLVQFAREEIVKGALADGSFDYIWFVDDDMTFPPDTLIRLLAHQKSFVTALAYQRRAPYNVCIFDHVPDKTEHGHFDFVRSPEHTGLRKIGGCGFACALISTEVFQALEYPRFKFETFGEDLHLCRNAMYAGIPIYADTDLIIGHLGDVVEVDEGHVARYKAAQAQQANQLAYR